MSTLPHQYSSVPVAIQGTLPLLRRALPLPVLVLIWMKLVVWVGKHDCVPEKKKEMGQLACLLGNLQLFWVMTLIAISCLLLCWPRPSRPWHDFFSVMVSKIVGKGEGAAMSLIMCWLESKGTASFFSAFLVYLALIAAAALLPPPPLMAAVDTLEIVPPAFLLPIARRESQYIV